MRTGIYCSTYCNKAHEVPSGKPIEHECRIIPPMALRAEMDGSFDLAMLIMEREPVKIMRRGVKMTRKITNETT